MEDKGAEVNPILTSSLESLFDLNQEEFTLSFGCEVGQGENFTFPGLQIADYCEVDQGEKRPTENSEETSEPSKRGRSECTAPLSLDGQAQSPPSPPQRKKKTKKAKTTTQEVTTSALNKEEEKEEEKKKKKKKKREEKKKKEEEKRERMEKKKEEDVKKAEIISIDLVLLCNGANDSRKLHRVTWRVDKEEHVGFMLRSLPEEWKRHFKTREYQGLECRSRSANPRLLGLWADYERFPHHKPDVDKKKANKTQLVEFNKENTLVVRPFIDHPTVTTLLEFVKKMRDAEKQEKKLQGYLKGVSPEFLNSLQPLLAKPWFYGFVPENRCEFATLAFDDKKTFFVRLFCTDRGQMTIVQNGVDEPVENVNALFRRLKALNLNDDKGLPRDLSGIFLHKGQRID